MLVVLVPRDGVVLEEHGRGARLGALRERAHGGGHGAAAWSCSASGDL